MTRKDSYICPENVPVQPIHINFLHGSRRELRKTIRDKKTLRKVFETIHKEESPLHSGDSLTPRKEIRPKKRFFQIDWGRKDIGFLAQIFKKCFIKFVLQLNYSYICAVMGTKEKLIERFKTLPSDFTFNELERLLGIFGYEICNKGRTSGSRIIFKNESGSPIMLHKPHPGNIVKEYALRQVFDELKNRNLI